MIGGTTESTYYRVQLLLYDLNSYFYVNNETIKDKLTVFGIYLSQEDNRET